ncbi:hypothetical protein N0V90_003406 [Kalmusia sp. IMI 367209]|nr:hypothetical protein N0V90_003406 [Kalmusia sp. IMI 367209]
MLFTNTVTNLLAACAILVPSAIAVPTAFEEGLSQAEDAPLEARALDMKVKWHSKTNCKDSGGPNRSYSRGVCMPLTQTDHGVKIVDRVGSCTMHTYTSADCSGSAAQKFSAFECHSLQSQWSVKIYC